MQQNELQVLFDDFLREQQYTAGARPDTLEGYRAALSLLFKLAPDADLKSVQERSFWIGLFETLQTRTRTLNNGKQHKGVKNSTLLTYRSKWGKFMRWLVDTRQIKENPLPTISKPHVEYVDRRYLTETEIHKLLQFCQYDYEWATEFLRCRNYTILKLLILTGIRRNELLGFTLESVNMEQRTLTVEGKTSKSKLTRTIPLQRELMVELQRYLRAREDHPIAYTTNALFVSSKRNRPLGKHGLKHLADLIKQKSGVNFFVHRCRHTYAANLYAQGVSLSHVQQLMGHVDPRMTLKYGRQVTTEALRDSVEKLGNGKYVG
ncbi:hypothetical protein COV06_01425 [Candidatus Uhrbacteria bacterium CG10_big_fil_rev_8_21_14_0_10_50_16]|uniref:Tyr recombinase domain-containing protein n=1 Tax=Candidatus Uhrbacteria bacterium CG10_big_fil_rev_8_21_14_0_10_50_16 TaxID=1975039 RepID=A0A2H0RNA9_9BACT|nr:MAG: hypothetical protein COV06_01425 [Candidatus Uhrbacteria bacterium CG10_big_fil_rev_8_21_14_0_10_50_16]